MMKYIGQNTLLFKKKKKKNTKILLFEMNLYFMKLNFYFNELCALLTTCKLELHDSG